MGYYRNSMKLSGSWWQEILPVAQRLHQMYMNYQATQSELRRREMQLVYESELEKARKEAEARAAAEAAKALPIDWVKIIRTALLVGGIGLGIVLITKKAK